MRRKFALVLTGLLVFSLVGCGKETGASVSESVSETVSSVSVEEVSSEVSEETSVEEVVEEEPVEEELYIREFFAEHGLKAGTCLTTNMINDPEQEKLILEQFSSVTMENAMKPDYLFNKEASVQSGDLVVEFNNDVIKMLDWAKANDMAVRGHTLCWYSQTPNWIFYKNFDTESELVGRDEMLKRMDSYFSQVFSKLEELGYIDLFYAYDVVNEAWEDNGTMRENNWKKTIGDDYLWQAFNCANKYAPESIDLYYNDYNEQFKTDTLVDFVNTLKDDEGNYLIDGVGFQAHLYTEDNLDDYFYTVDTIGALGLKVELTELDVCLGSYMHPKFAVDENRMVQGQFYYNLIGGLLERVDNKTLNMDAITFWGFSDAFSWRDKYYPCLYDKKMQKKYAFYAVMQVEDKAGFVSLEEN